MFSIGDFASHGRVSVRMLRHYDAIGLLRPARVDPATGYRSYEAAQLARLNRVVALKDLGFTLVDVQSMVDDEVSPEELRGMLRLRRAELRTRIEADAARLRQVEARLRIIEREGTMPADDVQLTSLPAVRMAFRSGVAGGFDPADIGPVIQPLYPLLCDALDRARVTPTGPSLAWYEDAPDGGVLVHAGLPVTIEPGAYDGFEVVDLPPVEQAATIVHRGVMDDVMPTVQALAQWIEAHGFRSTGYNRELYLSYGEGPGPWAVELQEPVRAR
ncbi:MAG TPA: MerR family transcriptional regulator [Mycobacteriales bacterium]|nr:MerR family transcriptional regulator [Mycobacteriales bacterium]